MAGKTNYTIYLNLGGDALRGINEIIRRVQLLNRELIRTKAHLKGVKIPKMPAWVTRGGSGRPATPPPIPDTRTPFQRQMDVMRGRIMGRFARYRNELTFPTGSLRYFGVRSAMSGSRLIGGLGLDAMYGLNAVSGGALIPIVNMAVATALPAVLTAMSGGLFYTIGTRIINSAAFSESVSRQLQYGTARIRLGDAAYDSVRRFADMQAMNYGASRTGTIGLMSTFTGFEVGGKQLTPENAMWLTRFANINALRSGKNSAVVGLNLQQILSTGSGIDIKELIKSDPMFLSYLREEMHRANYQNDIYQFVRERPQGFIDAAEAYMQAVPVPEIAKLPGRMSVAKENLWDKVTTELEPIWEGITDSYELLMKGLEGVVDHIKREFLDENGNLKEEVKTALDTFVSLFITVSDALVDIVSNIVKIVSFLRKNMSTLLGPMGILRTLFPDSPINRLPHVKKWDEFIKNVPFVGDPDTDTANRIREEDKRRIATEYYRNQARKKGRLNADRAIPPPNLIDDLYQQAMREGEVGEKPNLTAAVGANAADQMKGIAANKRSLIINFNQPVVTQDIQIDGANDEDITNRFYDVTEEAVATALMSVFHTTTANGAI